MGIIVACCGHEIPELEDGVALTYRDFVVDRGDLEHGGGMGEISGFYCKKCAKVYKKKLGAWETEGGRNIMDDNAYILGYETGVDAGRREVVDWLMHNFEPTVPMSLSYRKWHKKLGEWGIK